MLTRQLSPEERRVALLIVAGTHSVCDLAVLLETSEFLIHNILERPHVARYITRLTAELSTEIAPIARCIEAEMESVSAEAFDRLVESMQTLDELGDRLIGEGDYKSGIRAKLGARESAQDILDRAGKRAPTRSIGATISAQIPVEQLDKLERIFAVDRPGGVGGGGG